MPDLIHHSPFTRHTKKTRSVLVLIAVGFVHAGCFHADINTDYARDSTQLVANMRSLPAVVGLVYSEEERQRQDHVWHFGVKVTVDTGIPMYELSKASVSHMFDEIIEYQDIEPGERTDLFPKPGIEYINIRVEGIAYTYFPYFKVSGRLSLKAYDSKGAIIWSDGPDVNYRSGRAIHALWLLTRRNKFATDAYREAFLPAVQKLLNEFYSSKELQEYLCSIGKCTQGSRRTFRPTSRAEGAARGSLDAAYASSAVH